MTIIYQTGEEILNWPVPHHPNSQIVYPFIWRPPVWTGNTEVVVGKTVIRPTSPNGLYFEGVRPGSTHSSQEPTWGEGFVSDGTATWKSALWDFVLNVGDQITQSTWSGTGLTLDNTTIVDGVTRCRVTGVPAAEFFVLSNAIHVTRADTSTEVIIRSIKVPIEII